MWAKVKSGKAKAGFDKVYSLVDKLGPPVNRLSNKLGMLSMVDARLVTDMLTVRLIRPLLAR
jgi:hypothetical protein